MMDQPKPRSRRWWNYLALSVRGSIALVVVIAAALAWISIPAALQRNAVEAIEASGGKVWYDSEPDAAPVVAVSPRPPANARRTWRDWLASLTSDGRDWLVGFLPAWPPPWLVDALGIDYFGNVVSVSFTHRATDAELIQVAKLKRVERVDIHGSAVTERGLAKLKELPHLQTLLLVRTKVGDAGLAQVQALTGLRVLSLRGTELSDRAASYLKGLTNLEELDLASTGISDAGLEPLKGLTALQSLKLSRTGITDAGLAHLENLTRLQELTLDRTKVTDAGLVHVKALVNLAELILDRTAVSDAGLAQIDGLNQLTTLSLDHTRVSAAGTAQLQLRRAARQAKQTTALQGGMRPAQPAMPALEITP